MNSYLTSKYIQTPSDWYRVSTTQLAHLGGKSLVSGVGGMFEALKIGYPDHKWEQLRVENPHKKAAQRWLKLKLREVLAPGTEIIEEHGLKIANGVTLIVDLFVPTLRIAIEYLSTL